MVECLNSSRVNHKQEKRRVQNIFKFSNLPSPRKLCNVFILIQVDMGGEAGSESADVCTRNFKTIMEQEGIHHLLSGERKVCKSLQID